MSDEHCDTCAEEYALTYRCVAKTATVSHRCARCSATLDEASAEGHGAVCFAVGDWVRGEWRSALHVIFEGEVVSKPATIDGRLNIGIRIASSNTFTVDSEQHFRLEPGDLRRIPRPEQPTLSARLGHLKHGPGGSGLSGPCDADCKKCEVERCVRPSSCSHPHPWWSDGYGYKCQACDATGLTLPDATEPTLYDGLTSMECLGRWYENRARVEFGHQPKHALTAGQIAHAKVEWLASHGQSASRLLRARIDAAREQERVRVQIDADPDDMSW